MRRGPRRLSVLGALLLGACSAISNAPEIVTIAELDSPVLAFSGDGAWACQRRGDDALEFRAIDQGAGALRAVSAGAASRVLACGPGSRFVVIDDLRVRYVDPSRPVRPTVGERTFDASEVTGVLGPTRDGRWLGCVAVDTSLRMLEIATGRSVAFPKVTAESMQRIAVTPDGRSMIVAWMGLWGAPHPLADLAYLDAWSLRDGRPLGGTGLRTLEYDKNVIWSIASIAFLPNGELVFADFLNIARIDVSKRTPLHRREGMGCLGFERLGADWAISTHLHVAASAEVLWHVRRLPGLEPIPGGSGFAMDAIAVATAAPRFVARAPSGPSRVYEIRRRSPRAGRAGVRGARFVRG